MMLMLSNPAVLVPLFILMVLTLISDMRLSSQWNASYFLKGPVIFLKRYRVSSINGFNELSQKLKSRFSSEWLPSIMFKQLDQNAIGFRETLFDFVKVTYTPIMHGTVRRNNTSTEIIIEGRPNWFLLSFSLLWLLSYPFGVTGIIFFIALISLLYGIQYYRFNKIGETVIKILTTKTGT